MMATLLTVILISFIGVGLPDSVLGTAWPLIYRDFGLPLSVAGYLTAVISVGTIISSLLSSRLIKLFGTGLLTAISTLLTAIALLGFAFTENAWFFFLLSIPLGIGAGAIDTALNAFVVLHYDASKTSFLHCFYGLGVATSPFVLSLAFGENGDWRKGYFIVAILQFFIVLVTFVALPLWKKVEKRDKQEGKTEQKTLPMKDLWKKTSVRWVCFAFFTSCALELTAGSWSSTFFVNAKGLSSDKAALVTMLFYIGLTSGRFLSGVTANKLGRRRILRISLIILPVALFFCLLPLPTFVTAIALFFIGLGIGPVYPNLMHLTPKFFGEDIAQSVMGIIQASTYIGILIMPSLFGVLAENFTVALLPWFLLAMLLLYALSFIMLLRVYKREKKKVK